MLVVIVVYCGWRSAKKPNFKSVADLCLAACAIWVISDVRRYAKLSRKPEPEQIWGLQSAAKSTTSNPVFEARKILVYSSHVVRRIALRHCVPCKRR